MKNIKILLILTISFLTINLAFSNPTTPNQKSSITINEIKSAQKEWAEGLIHIGSVYKKNGDYKAAASNLINQLYAYNYGKGIVLFKPTKATEHPFRRTKEGALSYFVGGNDLYAEDKGFALAPWINISFKNNEFFMYQGIALVMGEYTFTDSQYNQATVEYTFGYIKAKNGKLKIILQHSSLPYTAKHTADGISANDIKYKD
jgi:hypothetical protein